MTERSFSQLPISSSQIRKRIQSSRRGTLSVSERWVHAIPLVLLLCFFILWWFSHPVTVEIENGRIVAVHRIDKPTESLNETRVDIAILASATSPTAESLPVNLTLYDNGTEPMKGENPVNITDRTAITWQN